MHEWNQGEENSSHKQAARGKEEQAVERTDWMSNQAAVGKVGHTGYFWTEKWTLNGQIQWCSVQWTCTSPPPHYTFSTKLRSASILFYSVGLTGMVQEKKQQAKISVGDTPYWNNCIAGKDINKLQGIAVSLHWISCLHAWELRKDTVVPQSLSSPSQL